MLENLQVPPSTTESAPVLKRYAPPNQRKSCMIFADFFKKLQDAVSDVKNEIAQHLVNLEVSNFSMAPVKVC
ncbi:hypothetical protein JHK82_035093 [Glycine max]|uniref:Uncharacterized protein n=1 Tax=Glycine soja TaxID=3848 RepID=A0A0B2QVR6_GLYSO|nr:hypothetical protein JHK85_035819 [Glycine max]KAG5111824.1 hypothetical protein JHK82_035093 [Glycine max]KHN24144.1 hypothetical protein glysoja_049962 [Glycine soja]